ncbi:MAG: tripartite tricarboxylate transporter substrate binding protein [Variibacter sp.]|nr:tripartite tricarboxylate transporter substrate binding protein [Variibacter sp.]
MPSRRELLKGAAALPLAGGLSLKAGPACAQGYPSKTITVVVPFPPGGVADYAARPLAAFMAEKLGKNVVVENKGGAGGGVGHAYVARAEADGHTIMVALPSLAVIPEANRLQKRQVNYEMSDFVPVGRMFADAPFLAVKKDAKWKNFKEFADDVKANPGTIPYGTSGQFGTVHLAMEMFLHAAGLKMLHVPYQGGGPAANALLSDQVPVIPTLESIVKGQLDAGQLRVLAQFGNERLSAFPDVPTLQEFGYKDVIYILWTGVFAPAKTPANVMQVLRATLKEFMGREDLVGKYKQSGTQIGYLDGPDFAKFLEADTERLLGVTRKIGLS